MVRVRLVLETKEYIIYMALFNVMIPKYSLSFQNDPIASSNAPDDFQYRADKAAGWQQELEEGLGDPEEELEELEELEEHVKEPKRPVEGSGRN